MFGMDKIPYGRHNIDDDDINAVVEVLKSDYLTQGPKVGVFEEIFAAYHNAKYAVAFSNGTAALHGAYYASGICRGDEFITSANTFAASANAGLYVGASPVLCDITNNDYNIDLEILPEIINPKTKVITPVSYAGNPVDLQKIYDLTREKGITVIHDAAHAAGARIHGHDICDYADMAMVSFHPVKHITTGEGGIILTNSDGLNKKLKMFRTHGIIKIPEDMEVFEGDWYYEMQELGYNYRLPEILCALGISQMKKLDNSLKRRNEIALIYDRELSGLEWLTLPENKFNRSFANNQDFKRPDNLHSYHLYPVLTKASMRKRFFDYLRSNGIMVQVHYIPVHYLPYYQSNFNFKRGDFPITEDFYSREVSLPMFPELTDIQQEFVIDIIKKFEF